MATSARRNMLAGLETALNTITTGNGYANTVAQVELVAQNWHGAQQTGSLPYIGIHPGRAQYNYHHTDCIRVVLGIQLALHVNAATDTEAYDDICSLIDDVIGATMADHTLAGTAIEFRVLTDDTDIGNPDRMESHGGTASAVLDCQATFFRSTSIAS